MTDLIFSATRAQKLGLPFRAFSDKAVNAYNEIHDDHVKYYYWHNVHKYHSTKHFNGRGRMGNKLFRDLHACETDADKHRKEYMANMSKELQKMKKEYEKQKSELEEYQNQINREVQNAMEEGMKTQNQLREQQARELEQLKMSLEKTLIQKRYQLRELSSHDTRSSNLQIIERHRRDVQEKLNLQSYEQPLIQLDSLPKNWIGRHISSNLRDMLITSLTQYLDTVSTISAASAASASYV